MSWLLMAEMTPAEREQYVDSALVGLTGFADHQTHPRRSRPSWVLRFRRKASPAL